MRKPFDIEAAKAGAKIITREGRYARILAYDLKNEDYKLVVVIQAQTEESYSEEVYSFTEEGKFYVNGEQSDKDLFIEVEPTYSVDKLLIREEYGLQLLQAVDQPQRN